MNKQIRFTSESLSPLYKMSVGFDRLAEQFFNDPTFTNNATGYPPFNISKGKDDVYEITLAVAGFKKDDIEIEIEDGTLKISGTSAVLDSDEIEYLHKGIAERNFTRTFNISDDVEIGEVKFVNGLLTIELQKIIPDHQKKRVYDIG